MMLLMVFVMFLVVWQISHLPVHHCHTFGHWLSTLSLQSQLLRVVLSNLLYFTLSMPLTEEWSGFAASIGCNYYIVMLSRHSFPPASFIGWFRVFAFLRPLRANAPGWLGQRDQSIRSNSLWSHLAYFGSCRCQWSRRSAYWILSDGST